MEKRTRNRNTYYDSTVTFRIGSETMKEFKEKCKIKGKKYNEVLRTLIETYNRANS